MEKELTEKELRDRPFRGARSYAEQLADMLGLEKDLSVIEPIVNTLAAYRIAALEEANKSILTASPDSHLTNLYHPRIEARTKREQCHQQAMRQRRVIERAAKSKHKS